MKLAVISDIHGNRFALEAVLEEVDGICVDAILSLGDFLAGPVDPAGTAGRLMGLGNALHVRGNHDRYTIEGRPGREDWAVDAFARSALSTAQRDWLAAVPAAAQWGDEVFLCHGTPSDDNTLWLDEFAAGGARSRPRAFIEAEAAGFPYPVLVCGHSHVPRVLRLGDGRLVVNPGSVGLQLGLGSTAAHFAILEKRGDGWRVAQHAIPYDVDAAATAAGRNGFPAYAEALRTGWMLPGEI